jgi:hypothetical protein
MCVYIYIYIYIYIYSEKEEDCISRSAEGTTRGERGKENVKK